MVSLIKNRSLIEVRGNDRLSFIQNLITNDIRSDDNYIYAIMLSPGGRFLFDMFILKEEDRILLDVFSDTKNSLLEKLDLYNINQDVELKELPEKIYYSQEERGNKDPRYDKLGYRFISNESFEDDNSWIYDKYEYSIPDGGIDLIYDKAMPQEYGAEELGAISYTKGCYVGQEVISRTKYQGEIRKKIYSIISNSNLSNIQQGTPIMQQDKKVGIFLSANNNKGIALIREMNLEDKDATINGLSISLKKAIWY
jgi:folate-binding protein YgfZ